MNPKQQLSEADYDPNVENNEFYFESDHLALRTNQDYRNMLKYIVSLECQKIMLIKDIENLSVIRRKALEEPSEFVDDLKNGRLDLPGSRTIPEMPSINWSQYGVSENFFNMNTEKQNESEQDSNILIRGRIYDQTKPQTFNQLWTCEEQKRLEQLLGEFPEEEVEMRRWAKIANALGNRTPKQVMSRVQKYFIKLQRAGLPVPGRYRRGISAKSGNKLRNQRNKILKKKSTFFPAHNVPILMEEQFKVEPEIEYEEAPQWTPLELMQAVYERRKIEEMTDGPLPVHEGVSCSSCKSESILGTCWTDGLSTNWCSDCLVEFKPSTRMTPRNTSV